MQRFFSSKETTVGSNTLIKWIPPPEAFFKINVDGSFTVQSNNLTCGGVIRDQLGKYILGISCNLGSCSIMHAKL
ncbi:hypothetical protein AHAS_Ahas19G0146600 [Arachis hypogaea]